MPLFSSKAKIDGITVSQNLSQVELPYYRVEVEKWKKEEVEEWLADTFVFYHEFTDAVEMNDKKKLGETMTSLKDLLENFKVVDGKSLLNLHGNKKAMDKFKIDNVSLVEFLQNEISHMKRYKYCNHNRSSLLDKLKKLDPQLMETRANFAPHVEYLLDRESVASYYLNENLVKQNIDLEGFCNLQFNQHFYHENKESLESMIQSCRKMFMQGDKQLPRNRMKILVSEVSQSTTDVEYLLCPITGPIPRNLSTIHASLVIGPFLLEFNGCGIIVPKRYFGDMASLIEDCRIEIPLEEASDDEYWSNALELIADLIVEYNIETQYVDAKSKRSVSSSKTSVDFVFDVFKTLGLKPNLSTTVTNFLHYVKDMESNPQKSLEFYPSNTIRQVLQIQEKVIEFTNHKEMDFYLLELQEKIDQSQANGDAQVKEELDCILRPMNRIFWIRHRILPLEEENKPLYDPQNLPHDLPVVPSSNPLQKKTQLERKFVIA